MRGIIERRVLANFRLDPEAASQFLPDPFRPALVNGWAIAGICFIKLRAIRPSGFPAVCGFRSENAAHRFAVEWDSPTGVRSGVYIPRRDTSSRINSWVGGRLFPGVHQLATFETSDTDPRISVAFKANDGSAFAKVSGIVGSPFPSGSIFTSLAEASAFFETGSIGYSATKSPDLFDGLELRSHSWKVEPLMIDLVDSSFFTDGASLPAGTAEFDCALLMREISHEWLARDPLCCEDVAPAAA
ncbi:MAG: DUF2071 domain-containing protein [Myxococcota bacterium]